MSTSETDVVDTRELKINGIKTIDFSGNVYIRKLSSYSYLDGNNLVIDENRDIYGNIVNAQKINANTFNTKSIYMNDKLFVDKFKNIRAGDITSGEIQSAGLNTANIKINGKQFVDKHRNIQAGNMICSQFATDNMQTNQLSSNIISTYYHDSSQNVIDGFSVNEWGEIYVSHVGKGNSVTMAGDGSGGFLVNCKRVMFGEISRDDNGNFYSSSSNVYTDENGNFFTQKLSCQEIDTNAGQINCGYIDTGFYNISCYGLNTGKYNSYGDSSGYIVYGDIECGNINTHNGSINSNQIVATTLESNSVTCMTKDTSGIEIVGYGRMTGGNFVLKDLSGGFIMNETTEYTFDSSGIYHAPNSAFIDMKNGYMHFAEAPIGFIDAKSVWLTDSLNVNSQFNIDGSGNTLCNNLRPTGNVLLDISGSFIWNNESKTNYESTGILTGLNTAFIDVPNGYLNFGESKIGGVVGKNIVALDSFSTLGLDFQCDGSGNLRANTINCFGIDTNYMEINCGHINTNYGEINCGHINTNYYNIKCNGLDTGLLSTFGDTSGDVLYAPISVGNILVNDSSGGYIWNYEAQQAINLYGNLHLPNSAFINMHYGDINFENARLGIY